MTPAQRLVTARYAARFTYLCLGVLLATLVKDPHFAALGSEPFLVAVTLTALTWIVHVLGSYAETGTLPPDPPAAEPVNPPAPQPLPPPIPDGDHAAGSQLFPAPVAPGQ